MGIGRILILLGCSHGLLGPRSEKQTGVQLVAAATVSVELDGLDNELTMTEVVVSENKRGLVPTVCPSEPFERYTRLHREIMDGTREPRYLVFRPYLYCGMGNRLSGFRGVLALAMMTDRALLVDWYGGLHSSHPATRQKYEDKFLEAHGVPWGTFPSALEDYEHFPDGATNSTEVWCQIARGRGIATPCDESRMTPHFLSTADWDHIYAEGTKVVIVQAHNGNPVKHLRRSEKPGVEEALRKLDDDVNPDLFGTCSLRFLLKARTGFRDRYCKERSAVLNGKAASVSLHIRTADNPHYRPDWLKALPQVVDNFVECAAGFEEGLAEISTSVSGPDPEVSSSFGDAVGSVWLLGTDSLRVIEILKEGNHTVEKGGKVVFIDGDESHRAHSGTKGGGTNVGPAIDLALLSEAPMFVGSYRSTFSLSSAIIGGRPVPLRVMLSTPFLKLLPEQKTHTDWNEFDDYRQGCRDLVSNPGTREDLRLSMQARLEPWIGCDD